MVWPLAVYTVLVQALTILLRYERGIALVDPAGDGEYLRLLWGGAYLWDMFGAFWFIQCLFLTRILYWCIARRWSQRTTDMLILGCYVLAMAHSYATPTWFLPWSVDTVPMAIAYFHIGVLAARSGESVAKFWLWALLVVFASGLLTGHDYHSLAVWMKLNRYGYPVLNVLVPLACVCIVFRLSLLLERGRFARAVLGGIGRHSLDIMFLHLAVFAFWELLMPDAVWWGMIPAAILAGLVIGVGIRWLGGLRPRAMRKAPS